MSGLDTYGSRSWKDVMLLGVQDRDRRQLQPFQALISAYATMMHRENVQVVEKAASGEGSEEQSARIRELEADVARLYQVNAEHSQGLVDYINKARHAEAAAGQAEINLQVVQTQKEQEEEGRAKAEADLERLTSRYDFMKREFDSRESMINELEQTIIKVREDSYAKSKAVDEKQKQIEELEQHVHILQEQVVRSATLINSMNDELANARAGGHSVTQSASSPSSMNVAPRKSSTSLEVSVDAAAMVAMHQGIPMSSNRTISNAHKEPITQVAYNMHGRIFATASLDATVKLWDSFAGSEVRVFKGHGKSIRSVAISLDDRHVLTGTSANTSVVYSIKGKQLHTLVGHTDKVTACAFVDGSTVVTGSHDRTLKLWDINRGVCLVGGSSLGSRVNDLCLTGTNAFITANHDGTIRLCDSRTLAESEKVSCHRGIVSSVTCTLDYNQILTASRDHTLSFIDTRKMEVVQELRHPRYQSRSEYQQASLSGCGNFAVAGGKCGSLFVWRTDTGRVHKVVKPVLGQSITCVKVAPSGFQMAVADIEGNITIWDS